MEVLQGMGQNWSVQNNKNATPASELGKEGDTK